MDSFEINELTKNAEVDQAAAGLATLAQLSRQYYVELLAQGFTPTQSFQFLRDWQATLLGKANGGK